MTLDRTLCLTLLCCAGLAATATAQQVPPPEVGDKLVTVKLVDGQVEMRDAKTGAPILMPKGVEFWQDKAGANSLAPSIEIQSQPTGFDVIYTFNNTGKSSRKLGALNVGIITLGPEITYPDVRAICEPVTVDQANFKVRQMVYPQAAYSPVWALQNDKYAVGVSIQYPILDYKHDVRCCLYSPEGRFAAGEGGRGWRVEFLLSNVGNETENNRLYNSGSIAPGEKRTYVVSVRVTNKPSEWVRTLVPYRNWLRGHYGDLEYTRNPRPINGRSFTSAPLCTDENPYGYGMARPDKNGWKNVVDGLMQRSGYDTLLLWLTSGAYRHNTDNNMPFQFATNWMATPGMATAIDPKIGFARLPAAGQKVGFWWGRSCQVADKWDDDTLEPLDPKNKKHRAAAFAELDMAMKAGASTIGLDTFSTRMTPLWDLCDWLDELKARYPGVRFCAEPVTCDLIHRKIPTYYRGHKDRQKPARAEDIDGFYNPHYLADFIWPGHETWGAFRWSQYGEWFGIKFSDAEKNAKLQQIASMGYVPLALDSVSLTVDADARNSWEYTVPADLQIKGKGDGGNGGDLGKGGEGNNDGLGGDPFPTFELFQRAFNAGDMRADLNGDGVLDFFDFTAWQNAHAEQNQQGNAGQNAAPPAPARGRSVSFTGPDGSRPSAAQVQSNDAPMTTGGIVGQAGASFPEKGAAKAGGARRGAPLARFSLAEIRAALARARGTTVTAAPEQ